VSSDIEIVPLEAKWEIYNPYKEEEKYLGTIKETTNIL
jgi:hypothetical protein